eukprot:CAMPEP_0201901954 /NCGR_PEP_ID=MMETSP0902-20130614/54703_1 /ASSEMBLY_ACC=CAM_ASM_000551 /TAXON_ID=420261 /ORGANISM="Thalassiosira antarctica, Strain CCMP982" /LENGTH=534 /DNA_ID=CAMNT_0048435939 /DNA_START=139 /DNA_END=1745 /DNA_ORIENTATION=-
MDQPRSNLFPVLKISTILQIMEEVNVPLTEAELTEPGRCKERVREVFVQLLNICWGLTDHTLSSLPKRIVTKKLSLSHPQLYDDALSEAKFFSLLSKLLRTCGYYEFGFKDLMAPQAKRFRRQLSAMINFLKYTEDMGHLVAQALDEREELFAALDEVTDNHTTLKGQLEEARTMNHEKMLEQEEAEAECKEMEAEICESELTILTNWRNKWMLKLSQLNFGGSSTVVKSIVAQREELFAALDEVTDNQMTLKDHLEEARTMNHEKMLEREEAEAECKEMEAEIAQQNKIQSSIRQETYLLKKSANELKDQIANLSIALRELQAEERQLSKEVVHSPDRIKVDLAEAMQKLEGMKKTILAKQRERTLVHKQVEHTTLAEESVKEIMMAMEKMESKVQEYEIVVEDCDDVKNRLEEMERDLEEKRGKMEEQERQLEVVEKQKSDTIATLTSVLQTAQNELDYTVNRLGTAESERLDGIAQIEASKKHVEELKSNIGNDRKKAEEEIANRIASFQKLEKMYWAKEEPLNSQLGHLG